MYFFIFKNENDDQFLLYEGGFVVKKTAEEATQFVHSLTAISLACKGGIRAIKLTMDELSEAVGGCPFKIYDFFGMGRKWEGVKFY